VTDHATEPAGGPDGFGDSDGSGDSDDLGDSDGSGDSDDLGESDGFGDSDDLGDLLAAAPGIGAEIEVDHDSPSADAEQIDAAATAADDATPTVEPDYLGDLQRVTAEFANFRKQIDKRNHDLLARASMRLVESLLPVLDALDAASLQGVDGVEPIQAQLLSVLGSEGLEVISGIGESFDPNRHDAVMTEQAEEGDDGTVVAEVLRTGYAWNGRVFRPAMVKARG
jgi:molecular chaperone GrpE